MRLMKLILLVVLAPLWLPHYLALMGVGLLIRRRLEWPAMPTRGSNARADRVSAALATSDRPSAAGSVGYRLRLSD